MYIHTCNTGGMLTTLIREERRKVSFRVAPKMTQRGAHMLTDSRTPLKHEIAVSDTLLIRSFSAGTRARGRNNRREVTVNGCKCRDMVSALVRLIEHEMLHLLFVCENMPEACRTQTHHGPLFRAAARRIFGHKDYRHDLITPQEDAHHKGVEAGCQVKFKFKGEMLQGRVNRVTKRATILVKCDSRHPEAREFSDGKFYRKFFVPVDQCTRVAS
mmetsp:Transcript_21752/g.38602  ORF Transcript_21752/g.38602 Transcript_21752/m.38602 type:complete len:215 (-) Transcript_21752:375-1019(-)